MGEVRAASLTEFGDSGGGFIGQDKDCILTNFKFITAHQFMKGKEGAKENAGKPATVMSFDLTVKEPDDDDHAKSTQYVIVGDPEHYKASSDNKAPSDEGPFIVLTGSYDEIWKKSPYGQWFPEIVNAGLDPAVVSGGINKLDGIDAHLVGKALPNAPNSPAGAKERKILVVSKINAMPGEKAKGATAPKAAAGKATAAPAAAASGNGADLEAQAHVFVKAALAEAPGNTLHRKVLTRVVFKATSDAKLGKEGNAITKLTDKDEFLEGLMDAGIAMFNAEDGSVAAL